MAIDTILLTVGGNATEGSSPWSGDEDARMWVGAVASGSGLYLCAVVSDDVFAARNHIGYGDFHDYIDFYIDTLTKTDINRDVISYWGMITWSTFRFRLSVNDSLMAYTWTDDVFMTWLTLVADTGLFRSWFPVEYLDLQAKKGVELFVPWQTLSFGNWTPGTPLTNRRLSFAAGYSDYDAPGDSGAIFWTRGSPIDDTAKNYWGEMQLAADMPPVAESLSLAPRPQRIQREQDAITVRYYSIAGRALRRGTGGVSAGVQGTVIVRVDGSGGARLVLRR